jgi:Rrf2 family protein
MRLSKRAEYGLIAAVRLAQRQREGGGYLRSRQIAEEEGLPSKFLEAILLQLKSASVLESKVGAGGGYRLTRESDEIRVSDVVRCLEPAGSLLHDPDADEPGDGAERLGGRALAEVNRRVMDAYEAALGAMTLGDLLSSGAAVGDGSPLNAAGRFREGSEVEGGGRRVSEAAV